MPIKLEQNQAIYMDIAINSLAIVKRDILDNKFDVTQLEVNSFDGERLTISVHQDWELLANKKEQTLAGQHSADINRSDKQSYTEATAYYMNSVNDGLPKELLNDFLESEPFIHIDDYVVDETSIGFIDNCRPCHGSGEVNCSTCSGSGSVRVHVRDRVTSRQDSYGNKHEISRIPEYEYRRCSSCGGSGKTTCKPCKGTGYITKITTITRSTKLYQTYALQPGSYSDKAIPEIIKIPTSQLNNIAEWVVGQSTAQYNHFQIQYVSQIDLTRFSTLIHDIPYEFLALNHHEVNTPQLLEKSPIFEEVLKLPLTLAKDVCKKARVGCIKDFLACFQEYKFLRNIMASLSVNPDYSKKNITNLVVENGKGYLSAATQEQLVSGITKSYKTYLPTHSKLAIFSFSIWLLFIYEILSIPFLPLARESLTRDSFYIACGGFVICFLLSVIASRWAIVRKYRQLPAGIITPTPKNIKISLIFSLLFSIIGFFTISVHDQLFYKYLGGSILAKYYLHHNNEVKPISSAPNAAASTPVKLKKHKHKG